MSPVTRLLLYTAFVSASVPTCLDLAETYQTECCDGNMTTPTPTACMSLFDACGGCRPGYECMPRCVDPPTCTDIAHECQLCPLFYINGTCVDAPVGCALYPFQTTPAVFDPLGGCLLRRISTWEDTSFISSFAVDAGELYFDARYSNSVAGLTSIGGNGAAKPTVHVSIDNVLEPFSTISFEKMTYFGGYVRRLTSFGTVWFQDTVDYVDMVVDSMQSNIRLDSPHMRLRGAFFVSEASSQFTGNTLLLEYDTIGITGTIADPAGVAPPGATLELRATQSLTIYGGTSTISDYEVMRIATPLITGSGSLTANTAGSATPIFLEGPMLVGGPSSLSISTSSPLVHDGGRIDIDATVTSVAFTFAGGDVHITGTLDINGVMLLACTTGVVACDLVVTGTLAFTANLQMETCVDGKIDFGSALAFTGSYVLSMPASGCAAASVDITLTSPLGIVPPVVVTLAPGLSVGCDSSSLICM